MRILVYKDLSKIWPTKHEIKMWEKESGRHACIPNPEKEKELLEALGVKKGSKVLIPCSYSGEWYKFLSKYCDTVALDFAKSFLRKYGGERVLGIVQALPFKDKSFDYVVSFEPTPFLSYTVLPMIPTLKEFLRVGKKVVVIGPDAIGARMFRILKKVNGKVHEKDVQDLVIRNRKGSVKAFFPEADHEKLELVSEKIIKYAKKGLVGRILGDQRVKKFL